MQLGDFWTWKTAPTGTCRCAPMINRSIREIAQPMQHSTWRFFHPFSPFLSARGRIQIYSIHCKLLMPGNLSKQCACFANTNVLFKFRPSCSFLFRLLADGRFIRSRSTNIPAAPTQIKNPLILFSSLSLSAAFRCISVSPLVLAF